MAIYNNLQVNYDGTIFQYSKDEKEGFEPFTNSKGKKSFRKYYKYGAEGVLVGIKKENNQYLNGAEEIKVTLKEGEDTYNILSFTALNQNGDELDEFTQSLTLLLPKMNLGETYTINNWYMKKGDTINGDIIKYSKKGVTVKKGDTKLKTDITFEHVKNKGTSDETHVKGDVPMLVWKQIAGKNRPTAESKQAKLIFLYELMDSNVSRLVSTSSSNTSTTTENSSTPQPEPKDVEPDDLPF